MNTLFKVLAIIFGILFLVSAGLQYNDPDPLLWVTIWGLAGIIALGCTFDKVPTSVPLVAGIAALIGFFYTYPEKFEGFEIGQGDIKNVEEGREAYGLLIIAIVMLMLVFKAIRHRSKV